MLKTNKPTTKTLCIKVQQTIPQLHMPEILDFSITNPPPFHAYLEGQLYVELLGFETHAFPIVTLNSLSRWC